MGKLTTNNPKCLVEINSISILDRLLNQFNNLDLIRMTSFFVLVIKMNFYQKNYKKFINKDFLTTNMMATTMVGIKELRSCANFEDDIFIFYGDCIFSNKFLVEFFKETEFLDQIKIPVDIDWREKWSKRYENIFDDVETLEYNKLNNKLISIGEKTLLEKQYMAQFMVLYAIPNKLIDSFIYEYQVLHKEVKNKISTTEFFQKTIGKLNYYVKPGKYNWTEVDTIDDLSYAKKYFF